MTRHVGLDVHREVNRRLHHRHEGHCLERHRIELIRSNLERFCKKRLQPSDRLALEATTNTWAVVEVIEPHVERAVVANPLRTRAIAEAKIKTDKVDAEALALLLRCDYLASVWRRDAPTRQLRELSTHRGGSSLSRSA